MNQEIRRLNGRGLNDTQIAKALGLSVSKVNRRRNHMRLPRRPPATPTSKIDDDALRRLHAQGLVDRQAAKQLGVSRELVQKRRERLGLRRNGWSV